MHNLSRFLIITFYNPGTLVFTHNTSATRWYAPHDMAKKNVSKIERVTEMDIKKEKIYKNSVKSQKQR